MRYLSVCSGVEAATVAWEGLGWEPVAFAEFDKFPSAVLAHRFPTVPNYGDITKFKEWPDHDLDLLVGGTPCQSFSVAGLRRGLEDPRGNLMLTFVAIAARYRPRWVVWENVPGVLNSGGGRDFGALLGALVELGYGCSWRVLDAQFFGVPQRRRRVFLVAHLGDERRAREVLADGCGAGGNPGPGDAAGERAAAPSEPSAGDLVPFRKSRRAQSVRDHETWVQDEVSNTLNCFDIGDVRTTHAIVQGGRARRLTPRESERLQGFPDDWTLVPYRKGLSPDGLRYKAIGNSMAVPCMRWLGERIALVDSYAP